MTPKDHAQAIVAALEAAKARLQAEVDRMDARDAGAAHVPPVTRTDFDRWPLTDALEVYDTARNWIAKHMPQRLAATLGALESALKVVTKHGPIFVDPHVGFETDGPVLTVKVRYFTLPDAASDKEMRAMEHKFRTPLVPSIDEDRIQTYADFALALADDLDDAVNHLKDQDPRDPDDPFEDAYSCAWWFHNVASHEWEQATRALAEVFRRFAKGGYRFARDFHTLPL